MSFKESSPFDKAKGDIYSNPKEPNRTLLQKHLKFPKVVNNWWELNRIEKELVMIAFKEAVIKGFKINQVPDFIKIRTGILISINFVFTLRKKEYEDNRDWYYGLAKDSIAYVGAYRKAIDEIKQYKDEMWSICLNKNATALEKIAATREMHSLTRTELLLLRDLPFITNLSKYYKPELLDPKHHNMYGGKNNPDLTEKQRRDQERGELVKKLEESGLLFNKITDKMNTSVVNQILDRAERKDIVFYGNAQEAENQRKLNREAYLKDFAASKENQREDTPISNTVMDDMRKQIHYGFNDGDDIIEIKRKQEVERKNAENLMYNDAVKRMENDIGNLNPKDENYNDKVNIVKRKFMETLEHLDSVISPEERETVRKLKELTDNQ